MLEHPEIAWIERTGYPSWMQRTEELGDGYDYEHDADDDEETIE